MSREALIQDVAAGHAPASVLVPFGLDVLPELARLLSRDLPIQETEALERVLKNVLQPFLHRGDEVAVARQLAEFQRQLGFLLKYKSYCVKAASVLGFSVFLQNEGEGFSFQQHTEHKVEVFHIVSVKPGGYLFVCGKDEWDRVFDRTSFAAWLRGTPDERYERFRYRPRAGDVVIIDRLNVVHTVMGCILEEYATVSTDMVDRLFDQNEGRPVPQPSRDRIAAQLAALEAGDSIHLVTRGPGGWTTERTERYRDGRLEYPIAVLPSLEARRHVLPAGSETRVLGEASDRASSLFAVSGAGTLRLTGRGENAEIPLRAGELTLVAAGARYQLINEGTGRFVVSEHRIPVETALVKGSS